MANARDRIRMTDDEIARFLDETHTLHVASINPDGTPHLVPMWFMRDGADIWFWTYGKSQKVMNLRRDPRITVMAEEGEQYGDLHGLTVRGRAEIVEDEDRVLEFGMRSFPKYFGAAPDAEARMRQMGAKRVLVIVHPETIASWDHRKL
jgi:PPOX class probable F420-dependent enzyme